MKKSAILFAALTAISISQAQAKESCALVSQPSEVVVSVAQVPAGILGNMEIIHVEKDIRVIQNAADATGTLKAGFYNFGSDARPGSPMMGEKCIDGARIDLETDLKAGTGKLKIDCEIDSEMNLVETAVIDLVCSDK